MASAIGAKLVPRAASIAPTTSARVWSASTRETAPVPISNSRAATRPPAALRSSSCATAPRNVRASVSRAAPRPSAGIRSMRRCTASAVDRRFE